MILQKRHRINQAVTEVVDNIDKAHLRRMQVNMNKPFSGKVIAAGILNKIIKEANLKIAEFTIIDRYAKIRKHPQYGLVLKV